MEVLCPNPMSEPEGRHLRAPQDLSFCRACTCTGKLPLPQGVVCRGLSGALLKPTTLYLLLCKTEQSLRPLVTTNLHAAHGGLSTHRRHGKPAQRVVLLIHERQAGNQQHM